MPLQNGNLCPLLQKDCVGLACQWFIRVCGTDPQTGHDVEEWGCAMAWLPALLVANAKETRQGAAAVESLRNEVVKRQDAQLQLQLLPLTHARKSEPKRVEAYLVEDADAG